MRKCTGNNTDKWGFDVIFDETCPNCRAEVEFFKDEITRICPHCHHTVYNSRKDYGCNRWCSSHSNAEMRNICPNFHRSKARFRGLSGLVIHEGIIRK